MSKEREVLRKILKDNDDENYFISCKVYKEIEELLNEPEPEQLTPREGLAEFKKGYMIGYNVAVRDLKQKVDSVFNLIMEEDDEC